MDFFDELEQLANSSDYTSTRLAFEVSNQLGCILDARGWNQSQLAEKMGVTRQYVNQVLSGRQNVTLKQLGKVCHALEVDPKTLFSARGSSVTHRYSWKQPVEQHVISVPSAPSAPNDGLNVSDADLEWLDTLACLK